MGEPKMPKSEIEIAIEKKDAATALFNALREDLFREAEELISEVPSTKIAIFITPPAGSGCDVATHSFGHPSAEGVLKTFLEDKGKGKEPKEYEDDEMEDEDDETEDEDENKDLSSPKFWWNNAKIFQSMTPEQVKAALEEIARHKNRLNLKNEAKCSSVNPEGEAKR